MKQITFLLLILAFSIGAQAQQGAAKDTVPTEKGDAMLVEAACGMCMFQMEGKDCELAVRIKGKPYYVDGTHIDSHGDAHAEDGFCNAIRKAKVKGEVVGNRFKATSFELVTDVKKKATKN